MKLSPRRNSFAGTYDFSCFGYIIDVAGGQSGLFEEILKLHPNIRATLFDQSQVVNNPANLRKEAFGDHWTAVDGHFFHSVPKEAILTCSTYPTRLE
jgi:hypothetical protein